MEQIAIISDIHGNAPALEAVINEILGNIMVMLKINWESKL